MLIDDATEITAAEKEEDTRGPWTKKKERDEDELAWPNNQDAPSTIMYNDPRGLPR